jgi:hypothetical protein
VDWIYRDLDRVHAAWRHTDPGFFTVTRWVCPILPMPER